jgi:beta-galactosidase GanA
MPRSTFPYGASYSPLVFSEGEWERDLAAMQGAGMNLARLGDVHGSWDRIEPRPGDLQLDLLTRFYHTAHEHGIHILLSTGASSPPLWLAHRRPDVLILSSRGERYPLGASYHWACIHHPEFRSAAESYLRALAGFAISQPNHFGWQISNEIGFPFMPAREKGDLGLYCYCAYCQAEFRAWLREKYVTLAELTRAWSWSTTNFVYNDWEEATAPESLPESWSGVTRWLDWRLFWMRAFARFAGWQHRLIRSIDPGHPTSVNTFNFKSFDRFGVYMGLDQWQLAGQVNHIGYDLYPGSGDKLKTRPEHNSIFLDHGRSVAQAAGSIFWIHEVESGPIGGWLLGPEHDTDKTDISNNIIECLGHNAKLILYMPWREWGYQPIHWGALVELDGSPTPRLQTAAELGAFIQGNADFLLSAQPPAAEVALLESKANAIFLRGVSQEEELFAAQRGAYLAFWEQGFGVDFITPAQLNRPDLARYRCICLPLVGLLSREQARRLRLYVAQGGILVGFGRGAALDENGWYHHPLPIPDLGEIFSIQRARPAKLESPHIHFRGIPYPAYMNREIVELAPGAEALAHFDDGLPAVTLAACGQGHGLFFATQADSGYALGRSNLLPDVIQQLVVRQGLEPNMHIESAPGRARGIDAHLLETSARSLLLFSNYAHEPVSATLTLKLNGRLPGTVKQLFPAVQPAKVEFATKTIQIQIDFASKEGKIIEINWQ